jgi:hypothetical protein
MKKFIFIIPTVILFACELAVDIELPKEAPRFTVNSVFNPDSLWQVSLRESENIFEYEIFDSITNANIELYEAGQKITTLKHKKGGLYEATNLYPEIGKTYELKITSPDYPSCSAISFIPLKPILTDTSFQFREFNDIELGVRIEFTVHDPPQENFYEIILITEYVNTNPETGEVRKFRRFKYMQEEDEIEGEIRRTPAVAGYITSDVAFNGKEKKFSFEHFIPKLEPNSERKQIVVVRSWNRDLFEYYSTAKLQSDTRGDAFGQPVLVYNNIKNGLGIFGGYSQVMFSFQE